MLNLKNKLPIIILIVCVISTFLVRFSYISLVLSLLSLLLTLLFSKKNIRIMLLTIIISIATIITNCIILYKQKSIIYENLFKDINILSGDWNYNFGQGSYTFSDDFSFKQYDDNKNKDNYCYGTYKYLYGGVGKDGDVIYEDNKNYYYDLTLNIDYCIMDNDKIFSTKKVHYVFGLKKNNNNDLIFIDTDNNNAFIVSKEK